MRASSLWVRDASYLKLKNMTVGYNFTDKKLLKKLGIRQLGIQLTGYNLLTFDKFDIMDPEARPDDADRSEEHTSELQSRQYLVCRLLLEKKIQNRQADNSCAETALP